MPERYTAQPGDCIHSIAFAKGFFPDTVWNHADNKSLKDLRKDPHVLMAGDTVVIPDKRLKELSKPEEKRHRFRRKGVPKEMKVQLMEGDQPVKNALCKVKIEGRESEITSDGEGWLKIPIPPNARKAAIQLPSGLEFELNLGHLDPVDQVSGVQGRLHSLGYYDGPINGQMSPDTQSAIKTFKTAQGLPANSTLDDQTRQALTKQTGS